MLGVKAQRKVGGNRKEGGWRVKDREITWGDYLFPFFTSTVTRAISIVIEECNEIGVVNITPEK